MAASTDLWGEIESRQLRTPLAILREQAALLGAKTQNLVEASVTTHVVSNLFYHNFNLVVPALDDYTYRLFAISHGPSIYPLSVEADGGTSIRNLGISIQVDTEEQFLGWLREKLSSPETKRIVSNLLAQVAA